jgi:hypothetical protein
MKKRGIFGSGKGISERVLAICKIGEIEPCGMQDPEEGWNQML